MLFGDNYSVPWKLGWRLQTVDAELGVPKLPPGLSRKITHPCMCLVRRKDDRKELPGSLPQTQMKPALQVLQVSFLLELPLGDHDLPKD